MIILNRDQMRRATMRLSMEIIEKNGGTENLVLIGICPRGILLAKKMQREIAKIEGVQLPLGALDISAGGEGSKVNFSVEKKNVALIDDIMYTGRTVRSALTALFALGTPNRVQLYTLIDSGQRELPFRPDGVGKNVPISSEESIKVHFIETDGEDCVVLQ